MKDSINDMLFAMQQQNLVYNHNFLYYSNKKIVDSSVAYNHPDGWIYKDLGANGEISYDEGTTSCLIQKSSDDSLMTLSQIINEFPRWQETLLGQKICAKVIIQNPLAAKTDFNLDFSIDDGYSKSTKRILFKPGDKTEVSIKIDVNPKAVKIKVYIECSTKKAIIYVNKISANIGKITLDTLPCIVQGVIGERKQYIATENPPIEELSLCNESRELSNNYTRLNSVLNGRFGIGNNGNSMLVNMSGYFSRAWNNGAKIDPDADQRTLNGSNTKIGDYVGSFEQDAFLKHSHSLDYKVGTAPTAMGGTGATSNLVNPITAYTNGAFDIDKNQAMDGEETRPKNIYELYTIKWA